MPDDTDQVDFDNPLEIQPVEASEDASAQREHGCRPRFPRTWAAWRRDLVKGHMWLSVWFMEDEEYEMFTKANRLACLLAKIALVMPMAYAVSSTFASIGQTVQDRDNGVLPVGAECFHACNCESTHCHFSSSWEVDFTPGQSLAHQQGDGNGCSEFEQAPNSQPFCGICAALPPDSQCSATRIVWIEPTGVRSGQAVTWADTCRAARLGPPDPSVLCTDLPGSFHKDGCRDRRARDSAGHDYDGIQLRMMADDFGSGNCTDCQDCSLWLSREVPAADDVTAQVGWVTTKVVAFILGNSMGLTTYTWAARRTNAELNTCADLCAVEDKQHRCAEICMKVSFLWACVCAIIFGLFWLLVLGFGQRGDLFLGYLEFLLFDFFVLQFLSTPLELFTGIFAAIHGDLVEIG